MAKKSLKAREKKALDQMIAEAEQGYNKEEYMTLADLKREDENV
ncbi:hypothetical protein [Pelosinus baikalensis]|nr:hypothetical protein [Pelosinus baikalensis]